MDNQERTRAGIKGLTACDRSESYDATRDPRTGRPPNLLEAQRLAQDREQKKAEDSNEGTSAPDQTAMPADGNEELTRSPAPEWQEPARMTSPNADGDEKAAVDILVQKGVAREQAEELVNTHGTNWEVLKAAAFGRDARADEG